MSKLEKLFAGFGAGLALISPFVPKVWPTMPLWAAYCGVGLGALILLLTLLEYIAGDSIRAMFPLPTITQETANIFKKTEEQIPYNPLKARLDKIVPQLPAEVSAPAPLDNISTLKAWIDRRISYGKTLQDGLVSENKSERIEKIHGWIESIAQKLHHNLSGQIRNEWFNYVAFPKHNVHSWDVKPISDNITARIRWLEDFKTRKVNRGLLAAHFDKSDFLD